MDKMRRGISGDAFFVLGLMAISVLVIAQPTLCTEQVIDSLEAGSPFTVGERIEWFAFEDESINLPALGVDNTTLLIDGLDAGA